MTKSMDQMCRSIWVLGYGQFGRRAAQQLADNNQTDLCITVVDINNPNHKADNGTVYLRAEAVQWFIDNFQRTSRVDRIIPALPVHLAADWVKAKLAARKHLVQPFDIPERIHTQLPNPYRVSSETYAFSHATFLCPADCDEPEQYCYMTGEPRPTPLYESVAGTTSENIFIHTIQSSQFAPGVAGFYREDLWKLLDSIRERLPADFLLCSACKCHGIITGFSIS